MYICPILSYSITIHNVHFDISSLLAFASHSISRSSGSRWRLKPDIQSKNWKLISGNQGKGLIQRFWSMCARRTESFGNLWHILVIFGILWQSLAIAGVAAAISGMSMLLYYVTTWYIMRLPYWSILCCFFPGICFVLVQKTRTHTHQVYCDIQNQRGQSTMSETHFYQQLFRVQRLGLLREIVGRRILF